MDSAIVLADAAARARGYFFLWTSISAICMVGTAGLIWCLAKWLTWVGAFVIPVVLGLIVGLLARDTEGLDAIMATPMTGTIVIIGAIVIVGALGSLSCMLLANIKKLEIDLETLKVTRYCVSQK